MIKNNPFTIRAIFVPLAIFFVAYTSLFICMLGLAKLVGVIGREINLINEQNYWLVASGLAYISIFMDTVIRIFTGYSSSRIAKKTDIFNLFIIWLVISIFAWFVFLLKTRGLDEARVFLITRLIDAVLILIGGFLHEFR